MTKKTPDRLSDLSLAVIVGALICNLTHHKTTGWVLFGVALLCLITAMVVDMRRTRAAKRSRADLDVKDRIEPQG